MPHRFPALQRFLWAFLLSASCLSLTAQAQMPAPKPADPAVLKSIDQEIWLPFIKAFATGNADEYIGLHSKNLIRPMGDAKRIEPYDRWTGGTRGMFKSFAERGTKVAIEFRFLERFANEDTASERGIFEFSMTNAKGETQKSYGKFHVILKKEDGKWKILMDYDSSEGRTINAESFKAAHAMADHAKY
jgi:hypothetical protein